MRRPIPLALVSGLFFLAVPALSASASAPGSATVALAAAEAVLAAPCKPGSGPKLRGRNFTNGATLPYNLRCADLTNAKLDEVDFTQKDLTGAILRNASMKEADFTQARLEYADMSGADLSDADLGQMHAKHATLRGTILTDAHGGQAEFPHADLTGAIMARAELTQANLTDATLVDADLNEATLGQIEARNADFTRAKLRDAKLGQAKLQFAVFKGANLTKAELVQAELNGADLSGATVEKASFIQADDVNLTGALGTPANVPDDAVGSTSNLPTGSEDAGGTDPLRPLVTRGSGGLGLVLVILSGVGLSITLILWGLSHRRRAERATRFAAARRDAEEDVIRLGEEIDSLDFDYKVNHMTTSGVDPDWRRALDAYEAAKQSLNVAQSVPQLAGVAAAVYHGREALGRVRSRLT
ncbi:pentapeptide repeat-containing protein [Sphaerisporangium sp. NPDC088356]|uniref:pentapeptide repeat-containing protein n=1 Tax=Sphaerisporangium sp. NPDC088356 TaxID=3154871 RepID=UPI00344683F4